MVPLTAITQALDIQYKVDNAGKRVIMNLETKPVAKFTVGPKDIYAGQTTVTYTPRWRMYKVKSSMNAGKANRISSMHQANT